MNDRVDSLRQRWQALAPREQWLCLLVGLALLSLLPTFDKKPGQVQFVRTRIL